MSDANILITGIIELILIIGIPVGLLIFFIVSLVNLCRTPKDHPKYRGRKTAFIVSAVLFGLLTALIIGFMVLLTSAMNHM
ncbi:hypothetical protein [Ruminococcus sp.]|uniref:hypothetical protein n=1 Tax=Ruminococcus sp. TaxID=41978 RepID=UPI002600E47F|nr:hypothetical protein [Ruminococcus sp.]MBQ6251770.1 hypothetical protein [Ruminococcus sp.]